ncbi:hypothetical protein [Nocardioides limicola]|uniref:hypothetical protein n=1 Tax=Nocardioides limicola TaxID=2803368 RepID=UPI00193AEF51|nr:hypothetical protein [Nocardioides sp. DJM-14]
MSKATTTVVAGGSVIGAAAVITGSIWAVTSFLSTGAQPAEALPAATLGYVSIDLDPGGAQKVEALRTLRQFPAFVDQVGLSPNDDVRRWLVDEAAQAEGCDLDHDRDVADWLGNKMAFAAVDLGGEEPLPAVVFEVTDSGAAEAGLSAIVDCFVPDEGGWALTEGWAVLSSSTSAATDVVAAAEQSSLADDSDFQQWTERVGGAGILTFFIAEEAADFLDRLDPMLPGLIPPLMGSPYDSDFDFDSDFDSDDFWDQFPEDSDDLEDFLAELDLEFLDEDGDDDVSSRDLGHHPPVRSAALVTSSTAPETALAATPVAGALRFADSGLEFEVVAGGAALMPTTHTVEPLVTALPASTAALFAVAFPDGWATALLDEVGRTLHGLVEVDEVVAMAEAFTGLTLPGDVETLLGRAAAVVVDADFDLDTAERSQDGSEVPIGLVVDGDPAAIEEVRGKLVALAGPDGEQLFGANVDGSLVALGPSASYRDRLLGEGGLTGSSTFRSVVPGAADAHLVAFVDVGARDWLARLLRSAGAPDEVLENVAPVTGIGVTAVVEDDIARGVLRVTTR